MTVIQDALQRDGWRCVLCGLATSETSLLFDSRLWDTPFPVDNVVSLCARHKVASELGEISIEDLRTAAGLPMALPSHLYALQRYDRWGNPAIGDGRFARGELFDEWDVQKALVSTGRISSFVSWVKYPRTHVLPWSESISTGDVMMDSVEHFRNMRVVATEKLDGQNITLYRDYFHSRSVGSSSSSSRRWIEDYWDERKNAIPDRWRICGEYLLLRHAVEYSNLPTFFIGFAVWNDKNVCLSWDETVEFFVNLDVHHAAVIFDGQFSRNELEVAWAKARRDGGEGYVLRVANSIEYRRFRHRVGKFIQSGYVQREPRVGKAEVNQLGHATG